MQNDLNEQTDTAASTPKAPLTTVINREYATRFIGVALLFIGLSGWFLYDGKVGYPQTNQTVAPFAETLAQRDLAAADWMNTAKTGKAPLAEAFEEAGMKLPSKFSDTFNSWISAGDPRAESVEMAQNTLREPVYSEADIQAQFFSAAIGLVAALGLLGVVLLRLMTRFTLDEEALHMAVGATVRTYPLGELLEVDDRQWEKRGILKVIFKGGRVTLDAWHHRGVRPIAERLMTRAAELHPECTETVTAEK